MHFGLSLYQGPLDLASITSKTWLWGALSLGILFILVFNIMAATSQKLGVSVASVATKMSFVVPVLLGVYLYKEGLGPANAIGVLIAVIAVYLSSDKGKGVRIKAAALLFPFLLFLGSGIIDAAIKFFEDRLVPENEYPLFSAVVFGSAAITGICFALVSPNVDLSTIKKQDVLGGLALGIPNYFSIFFLLKALDFEGLSSGAIFTINNVAIVLLSTVLGVLLFRETLNFKNRLGIVLAVISIILVT